MKKQWQILILSVVVLAIAPAMNCAALGEEPEIIWASSVGDDNNDVRCTLDEEGLLTVYGTGKMLSRPSLYNASSGVHYDQEVKEVRVEVGVTEIADYAFQNLKNVKTVYIMGTVNTIGTDAFRGCTGIGEIALPGSVTEIKGGAFAECANLQTVNLPTELEILGTQVFMGCESLQRLDIPDTVGSIGAECFKDCTGLMNIKLSSGISKIERSLLENCSKLHEITIPGNVTSIEKNAFRNCDTIVSITIPEKVVSIDDSAFRSCDNLSSVTLNCQLEYAGEEGYIFNGAEKLKTVGPIGGKYDILLGDMEKIPANMFRNNGNLMSIVLPDSVKEIGACAFLQDDVSSSDLTYVLIPASVEIMGEKVFNVEGLQSAGTFGSGRNIEFGWTESIPDDAFNQAEYLSSIEIPESVSYIGDSAFLGCARLESVNIPRSVNTIGEAAFSGCESIESITLPSEITDLPMFVFSDCTSIREITIPNGVGSIGALAFDGCTNLESVTLPVSVTTIGNFAFRDCGIEDVYYSGTETEKEMIRFGQSNEALLDAEWHCKEPIGDEVQVHNQTELLSVLSDPGCEKCTIVCDMEITESFVTINKKVTIAEGVTVVYRPNPDPESFYVKSLEMIEGGRITVLGRLESQSTFDEDGMTIAQIYVNGGTLDVTLGQVNDNCNICFNAGELYAPIGGFPENTEVNRFFWENATEEQLFDAMEIPVIRQVVLQTACTLTQRLDVPEGKTLGIWEGAVLTVSDNTQLYGNVSIDGGEVILLRSAEVCGVTTPEWASYTVIKNDDDGTWITDYYNADDRKIECEIVDFGDGTWMRMISNEDGELIWREMFDASGERTFWAHYTSYNYTDTSYWSADYEAFVDGQIRIGTDYMLGFGAEMRQVGGRYTLEDGSSVREDYATDESCMAQYFDAQGNLVEVRRIAPPPTWEVEKTWDMTDGKILELPAGTVTIGDEAFAGVEADKIVVPDGAQEIGEEAAGEDVLFIVRPGCSLIRELESQRYSYVVLQ